MMDDGWAEFFARSRDLDCAAESGEEEENIEDLQLTLSHMAVSFIVHACTGAFAVLLAVRRFL